MGNPFAIEMRQLSQPDLLEATESVTSQAYKDPTSWLVVLRFGDIVGAIQFPQKSWHNDSANVLNHRIKREFGGRETTLTDYGWRRLRGEWQDRATVVTGPPVVE